jgi:hypothetical protein
MTPEQLQQLRKRLLDYHRQQEYRTRRQSSSLEYPHHLREEHDLHFDAVRALEVAVRENS